MGDGNGHSTDVEIGLPSRDGQTVSPADTAAANESVVREVLRRLNGSGRLGAPEDYDEPAESGIDLRELYALLAKRWKFLFLVTAAGGMVAALIALAIPNTYTASALIMTPAKPQSLATALMGQLGGLAGAAGSSIGLGLKDPNEVYMGILRSRTATGDLVGEFGLQAVYSARTKEDAGRTLLDRTVLTSGRDSMIRIAVDDHDPRRAAALANGFLAELNKQNTRLALTESGQRRKFFEGEVQAEKDALADAERALRETQQRTGVVEVKDQAEVVITSIARLRAEIAMQEVALDRLQMGATAENPEVAKQQTALSALRGQLERLEAGDARRQSGDPLIPVASVPQAGLEYLRAMREVKYHETLFEVLAKQYEAARVDEAKEAPVIQVVDQAVPPERKSGPHRAQITLLGAFLAGLAGAIFVYFVNEARDNRPAHGAAQEPA